MTLANKKNPAMVLTQAIAYWWSLRRTKSFAWTDAWMNWREWLLPTRFSYRAFGEALVLLAANALYALASVPLGLHYLSKQEFVLW